MLKLSIASGYASDNFTTAVAIASFALAVFNAMASGTAPLFVRASVVGSNTQIKVFIGLAS
ncbi:hypothetical protein NFF59_04430 [Proteus mirabilis]|nr:hypothetical protein [Proteus mirabilis]